jgi:signal transduction histidine kinase
MTTEGGRRRWLPASVFVKVLVTLAVMAVLILVVVATFIRFFYGSQLSAPVSRLAQRHVELLAREIGDPPDVSRARAIGARHGFQIRYEGVDARWETADDMPSIEEARSKLAPGRWRDPSTFQRYYLVPRSNGTLLFRWNFGWAAAVHDEIVLSVLLLIVVFVLGAHVAIRYHLRPIRTLRNGVARLAEGDFEVQVPVVGADELATLSSAFNAMSRRIGEMVAARDQLLRDVSHELRSPITRMKLALELIPEDERKRSLEADIREMETMVAELLEIERLKDVGVRLEGGDLVALVRQTVLERQGPGPAFRLSTGVDSAVVAMDSARMGTVLKNILDNAAKYSATDSGPVEVHVDAAGGTVSVRVKDDGPGIPPGEISRVFDPFYRVDRSRSKETGGYGLGLSICKRIVEAHGGTIVLVNNPGRGATAIVTLPLAPASAARAGQQAASLASPRSGP